MRIAVTGAAGGIGRVVVAEALAANHSVVAIDRVFPQGSAAVDGDVHWNVADITDFDAVERALDGCDALIHPAAIPSPFVDPDHIVHNNNVVGSYNALRAAVGQGIRRVCQASSVNAIGLSYSRAPRFDYFPVDENHATYNEEPYGLSKWICEQQADSLVRRYADLRIASLRFHWVVPNRQTASSHYDTEEDEGAKHLWAYTVPLAAARACLLSLSADFGGHQVFYIAAPRTARDAASAELAQRYYPEVPLRGELAGHASFFSTAKAERLLGWRHEDI